MLRPLALLLFLATPLAYAQDGRTRLAEYERISQEMSSRASRNAWEGVEQAYEALLETGIPLTADEHHLGAQAANARGDLSAVRQRLLRALETYENPEYEAWIVSIHQAYGPVSLMGDPGDVALTASATPFDQTQVSAIAFAKKQVEETGSFEGLLPAGEYTFGDIELRVRPGVQTQRIDVRSDRYMRKLERQERKKAKEEVAG